MLMDFDLKEVFSILDENKEGLINLRRFIDVANNYYSDAEQLARITKALDPKNTGFINFDQFCDGISQISSLQGVPLKEVASDLSRLSRENSLAEDADQRSLTQDGSTTTFNEYDVENDETAFHHHVNKISMTTSETPEKQNPQSTKNSISPAYDSSLFADEEEFVGIAEPDSSGVSSDLICPTSTTSQGVSQHWKRSRNQHAEEAEQQLHETVVELQKTVDTLNDQKQKTTNHLAKIQCENSDLKTRLLALEDRLHDLEGQQERSSQAQRELSSDNSNRSFRQDKEILEASVMRINDIEAKLQQTQATNGQMKKDVKQLKDKLEDVDIQLHESQIRCNDLAEDNDKLLEQLRLQRQELEQAKIENGKLAKLLNLDSSQHMFSHTLNQTETIIKTSEKRIQDLDALLQSLQKENEELRKENEELRERAVANGIDEGRKLMANRDLQSYAAELEVLSKDELMSKLREQFTMNDRLRGYIERMLTVIIENSPQLLEITLNAGMPIGLPSATTPALPSSTNNQLIISSTELDAAAAATASTTPNLTNDKYCCL